MKWIFRIFTLVISLVVIIGVFLFLSDKVDNDLSLAILTAGVTIFISIFSIILNQNIQKEQIIEQQIREKKMPIYEGFLLDSSLFKLFKSSAPTVMGSLSDYKLKFILWASDDVLLSLYQFGETIRLSKLPQNNSSVQSNIDIMIDNEIFKKLGKLLLKIRNDLGHKNKNINEDILLSFLVKD